MDNNIKMSKKKLVVIVSIILSIVILITSAFYVYSKQNLNEKSKESTRKEAIEQHFSFDWYEDLSDEMYDYIMYLGEKGYHCESVMEDEEYPEREKTYDIECVDEIGNSIAKDYEPVIVNGIEYDISYSIYITGKDADKYYISPNLTITRKIENTSSNYDFIKSESGEVVIRYNHNYLYYSDRTEKIINEDYTIIYDEVCRFDTNSKESINDIMTEKYTVDENSEFTSKVFDENLMNKEQTIQLCNQLIDEGYTNQMYNDVIKDIESDFDEIIAEGERLLN